MDNNWQQSTEGDLDPDLTEEAGYSGWEPDNRPWLTIVVRLVSAVLVLALIAGSVKVLIR